MSLARHPPEVRTGNLIERLCDACQDLHREVVVFRPVGDEVRMCAGCLRAGVALLGYATIHHDEHAPAWEAT